MGNMARAKNETHLHFVGIGGIGMSGIAKVFANQGYRVSGSDLSESVNTQQLQEMGVEVFYGHRAENVENAHVVVTSTAVRADNPEVLAAKEKRIPVIPRAEVLGELMRGKTGIAVAGTHGKTTTTSLLASILTTAELDPTTVVGGIVHTLGSNAKFGNGEFVVAEADESDGSFLQLPAVYGIITNIDSDHLDYYDNLSEIESAFIQFVGKLPFYGLAAVCGEDPGVRRCLKRWTKPIKTYGFSDEFDIYATDLTFKEDVQTFLVHARDGTFSDNEVSLQVPGRHNVLNALGAFVIAVELGISPEVAAQGLAAYSGVKRRFEWVWKDKEKKQAIIDDYAHHPTEILATLATAKKVWPGRVIAVFQPHRYSRTVQCKAGFLAAFRDCDVLYVTDIYPGGEDPIEGVDSESFVSELQELALENQVIEYVGDLGAAQKKVMDQFQPGDLVLCLGAGSITRMASDLREHYLK